MIKKQIKKFSLSPLSFNEIVQYFKQFEIEICNEDVLKPSIAFITKFYNQLLEIFLGTNFTDDLKQSESKTKLNFIKKLTDFLYLIGLPNLSVKDILNPDSKKFIIICSYIINFSAFRDQSKEKYDMAIELINEKSNVILSHKVRERELNEEVVALENELKDNIEKNNMIDEAIATMENEINGMRETQELLHNEYMVSKTEYNNISDKICTAELNEHNLKNEIKMLEKEIISNPEKLYEIANELQVLLDKDQEIIHNLTHTLINAKSKNKTMLTKTQNYREIFSLVKIISETSANIQQLEKQISDTEYQIKLLNSSINNKKIKTNHLCNQIKSIEEKIQGLSKKDKEITLTMSGRINAVKEEYLELCENKKQSGLELNENKRKTQELLYERSQVENVFVRDLNEIHGMILNLKTQVEIMRLSSDN